MKKQLLLVDDDLHLRDSISLYLISEGFLVNTANNVESAFKSMKMSRPDLIIADIMMPHLDGYDFIKVIRADNALCSIPIIFLTAKGMTHDRIRAYNLGCNAYLTKPFHPQELVSIINSVFSNIELSVFDTKSSADHRFLNQTETLLSSFTDREKTILCLVVKGLMNKEIAVRLSLSLRNVEKYVSRLLSKTNTRNRTELAQFALSNKIC